jgi:glycosyltransferase involved in cell wall biosynthesis
MMVSVIIRTFNRAHSIRQAISSALQQTYSDFEILVVDDGSTDDTAQTIQSFADSRIRLLRHHTNLGVGAACNTGIRAANGEYIAWLDSDDLWCPEKLQRQVDFLRQHREVDAVFTDVCVHDKDIEVPSLTDHMKAFRRLADGRPLGSEFVVSQRQMYLCLLQEVPIKPTALVVRRGVFDQVGLFDESARSGEDWEFLLRLARVSSFGYIHQPLAEMNWTPDSTYHRFWLNDKTFLVGVFQREGQRLRQDTEAFNAARRGLFKHFKSLGYYYVEMGRFGDAAKTYMQGFKVTHYPEFVFQAGAAFIPLDLRRAVLRLLRLAPSPQR